MLSTDEVLVKDLYAGEYYPVAMERTKKDTRMYFFIRVPSKIDAASVEEGLSQYVSDFAIYNVATADKYVKDNKGLKIVEDNDQFGNEEYAIAVKKGNKELLDQINKSIKKMKESGKINELAAKYADASSDDSSK